MSVGFIKTGTNGRSPSLSSIVAPAEKTAARCGQSILDFRLKKLKKLKKLKRLKKATSLINPGAGDEDSELFSRFTDESGGPEPNRF